MTYAERKMQMDRKKRQMDSLLLEINGLLRQIDETHKKVLALYRTHDKLLNQSVQLSNMPVKD